MSITAGKCPVNIEMQHQGSSRGMFSWFLIVKATLRLTWECLSSWLWPESGAGVINRFGKHSRIVATVKYYKAISDGRNTEDA